MIHIHHKNILLNKHLKMIRFDDTNAMFVKPENYDFHVTTQDAKFWAQKIKEKIK